MWWEVAQLLICTGILVGIIPAIYGPPCRPVRLLLVGAAALVGTGDVVLLIPYCRWISWRTGDMSLLIGLTFLVTLLYICEAWARREYKGESAENREEEQD